MLNEGNISNIYSEIQNKLFSMIPERWDSVYLYASIIEQMNNLQTGEMFFYYYPAGIIKKNPINVYEVPEKFGVDEDAYNRQIENLYKIIKKLRVEYQKCGKDLWSNLTISIVGHKFNVEYHYEDLLGSKYSSYDRHLIWQHKYLKYPLEKFSKKERKMIITYLEEEQETVTAKVATIDNFEIPKKKRKEKANVDNYEEYKKQKEEINTNNSEEAKKKEEKINTNKTKRKKEKNSVDNYQKYKEEKQEDEQKIKNQILNI